MSTELLDDPEQKAAIEACCDIDKRIVAITGKPGTGKTTIMRHVFQELTAVGHDVVLVAPTGKAAKRIQEATDIPARTNHRLLEYPYPGERDEKTGQPLLPGEPTRDKSNPIDFNVVLADEHAMATHEVHRNLLDALPRGGVIRCFGDVNQLRPVETNKLLAKKPTPFMEILDNKKFTGIRLETNYRSGESIIKNADAILRGRIPRRYDDYYVNVTEDPVKFLTELVEDAGADDPNFAIPGSQMISPGKKSWVGTKKLNSKLQQLYHGWKTEWLEIPRHKWDQSDGDTIRICSGDKVIWTQNNYNLDGRDIDREYRNNPDPTNQIMNGETGIVTEISDYGEIIVDWGDRITTIWPSVTTVDKSGNIVSYDPRRDLDLAYVITTHKAQGSEYDHVLYILNRSTVYMHDRHNTYTATTRARHTVRIVSDQRSLSTCVGPPKELRGNRR